MFIYGEGSFKITKKRINSCKNEWFRPKFRTKFKLLWRGCVDRPKTPIIHGRKKYLQIRNTHCAWAKIFFHLWLYGEQHFFMQLCFAERTVIDWTALTRPSDYLTELSTTNGLRLQTIIHLKFTEFSLEGMTVAPLHKAKWDYSTLAQQTSKLARFSLYIIKENIWWCHRTRMRTASIILH